MILGADNKVHLYTLDVRTLTPGVELEHLGAVTDVRFSPDSKYLVASDANRKVILYSTEDYKVNIYITVSAVFQPYGLRAVRIV